MRFGFAADIDVFGLAAGPGEADIPARPILEFARFHYRALAHPDSIRLWGGETIGYFLERNIFAHNDHLSHSDKLSLASK
jgi:hypothetical protein